ncbi:sensor histidine kinase [Spirochaeta cellobiosiphila]|uniref:sensor histidine kinase n=1 Tax=Spirochaeta cellobiosiphila TaxID=504483 RepID=UPI00069DE836|nr:sensor histidine kinase [Spirochaeta cellobiosiphila]
MKNYSFRLFFLFLIFCISSATIILAGTAIFVFRSDAIMNEERDKAFVRVKDLSHRVEEQLSYVEGSMNIIGRVSKSMDLYRFSLLLDNSIKSLPLIRAMYILDENGKTLAVGTHSPLSSINPDFLGIDFSYTPLYNSIKENNQIVWSDKFISTLSGDTSVGAALLLDNRVVIAELSLRSLLNTLNTISNRNDRIWVIDRRGELVADTGNFEGGAGIINIRTVPFMEEASRGMPLDKQVKFENSHYFVNYSLSQKLGWLFLLGIPAGLHNVFIYNTLVDILLLAISFFLIGMIAFPFWSEKITRNIMLLRIQADQIANGQEPELIQKTSVKEFQDLNRYMREMYQKIKERETALRDLNQALERRVQERTKELKDSNVELQNTLDHLNSVQEVLIQSEKLAALGRLVAGVAHELNTPIGNAIMALSSIKDEHRHMTKLITQGLKKSDLDRFIDHLDQGLDIADKNIHRAAELIKSFKHVASDQTSSVRRQFSLSDIIDDVLLTLQPTIKRTSHHIKIDYASGIYMDSFPGVVVQIITNLITNALIHAWDEEEAGIITIKTQRISTPNNEDEQDQWIEIQIADNGKGIPSDYGAKVFDPFFTSKMGSGGTGLGLNIVYNGATNILGGTIDYKSSIGEGTTFSLKIPLIAPRLNGHL